MWARMNDWVDELGRRRATHLLTYGLAAYSITTGLVLAVFPGDPWIGAPYSQALALATAELWGWLMVILGSLTALSFWVDGKSAKFPALSLVLLYAALGLLTSAEPYGAGNGSPTVTPAYLLTAWIAALVVLTCSGKDATGLGRPVLDPLGPLDDRERMD